MPGWIAAAGKDEIIERPAPPFEPDEEARARGFHDLELNGFAGLPLDDDRARLDRASADNITDLQFHQIASTQLAVDGEVEQRAIPEPQFVVELKLDCPDLLHLVFKCRPNARLRGVAGQPCGPPHGCLALAPLAGGYAFELGGFVVIATLSTSLSVLAAVFAARVQAKLSTHTAVSSHRERTIHRVPRRIRILWWSTGLRYLGENGLYPLLVVTLYSSTIKLGWIAAAAALAGIAFGMMADRLRSNILLVVALGGLAIGWRQVS
jgi:hypothetical protein